MRSTWNQSTVGDRVHVCHVPDVVDVLGEVFWNQYICLATWNELRSLLSVPWIALKQRNRLGELGSKEGIKQYRNLIFGPPPLDADVLCSDSQPSLGWECQTQGDIRA